MIKHVFLLLFIVFGLSCLSPKEATLNFVNDDNIQVMEAKIYFNYSDEPITISDITTPFSFVIKKEGSFKIQMTLKDKKQFTSSQKYMNPMVPFNGDVLISADGMTIKNMSSL